MMKRKVLVISYYFPPMSYSGVQRTSKFVKYMPDFGWEPTVLTIQPKAYYAFDDSLLKELVRLIPPKFCLIKIKLKAILQERYSID